MQAALVVDPVFGLCCPGLQGIWAPAPETEKGEVVETLETP